jgi:hypothetical protein
MARFELNRRTYHGRSSVEGQAELICFGAERCSPARLKKKAFALIAVLLGKAGPVGSHHIIARRQEWQNAPPFTVRWLRAPLSACSHVGARAENTLLPEGTITYPSVILLNRKSEA